MDVSMLTYHHYDFFLPMIREAGIAYDCVEGRSLPQRIYALRRALRQKKQNVVMAFLEAPSLYAELAAIPNRKWGLVVSERSCLPGIHRGWRRWMRLGHLMADYVTTNSHTNRLMIERSIPFLKGRVITVYNAVDLETFSPGVPADAAEDNHLRLVVAASFQAIKNPVRLVEAMAIVKSKESSRNIHLDWYGQMPGTLHEAENMAASDKVIDLIEKHSLQDCVKFHPPVLSIVDVYRRAHALILPSFYEGLPNTVCEAMACGRPILMSNVCDAGNLVREGYNGFLFDPNSSTDIADTIVRFVNLTQSEKDLMGRHAREMAEQMFDPSLVAAKYVEILSAAAQRKRISIDHWVPQVPESVEFSYLQ
jgi:glycosyltransferase involved in cell wall biosynthesis